MTTPVLDLSSSPASPPQQRATAVVIATLVLLAALTMPFARTIVGAVPNFVPFYGGAFLAALAITITILFGQFALSRKPSLLLLACSMLFGGIVGVAIVVASPLGQGSLLAASSNTSAYLWTLLHASLPLAYVTYIVVAHREGTRRLDRRGAGIAIAITLAVAYAAIQAIFALSRALPVIYNADGCYGPFGYASLGLVALLAAATLLLVVHTRKKTIFDIWLTVPAAALGLESAIKSFCGDRYTIGWYVARIDVLVATLFLVIVLIGETNRLARILAGNERRFRGIVDGVADALVVVDAQRAIAAVNPAAAELFGFAAEDVTGTPISRIVPDFATLQLAPDDAMTETTARDARGRLFPVELARGRWVSGSGETILILRDITQRKATEEAIRSAHDRALEAAEVKAQFLAMMSHEIRTPINAVVGMSELLLQTPLTEEGREYATTVRDSAESLLAIVNDILDFSKIEAGKMELDTTPFSPVVAVENATDILAATARKKGLSLSTYVAPEVPRRVLGDPDRLRQVLLNLIGNAVKFTTEGSVGVRAVVERGGDATHAILRFSVTDTGPGIPREVGERLFEPFRQADGSTRRRFGGTGLGLSISRRIVELMGGRIGFDSSPGRGSTFWFTVPFRRAVDESPVDRGERLRGSRVLIVDEDPAARGIVTQYLLAWGATASSTGTAPHAFELAKAAAMKRSPFDAIIIDRGAGGDGIAFAARLAADADLAAIPLILLCGGEARITTQEAKARGFVAVLRKPLRQNVLHDTLVAAISGPVVARAKPVAEAAIVAREEILVLVAEDNPVNRKLALQQLKRLGYRAHAVADGREAIEAVSAGEYALVLMDCQMPDVDGFGATREIRRLEAARGTHVPIVAMTANALEGDREACLAAGMDGYLAKPVQLTELRAVVEKYTSGVGVAG